MSGAAEPLEQGGLCWQFPKALAQSFHLSHSRLLKLAWLERYNPSNHQGIACFQPATGPGGSTGQTSPGTGVFEAGQCSHSSPMQAHSETPHPIGLAALVFAPGAAQSPGMAYFATTSPAGKSEHISPTTEAIEVDGGSN